MMRFTPLRCPQCHELPVGTLESIQGVAGLNISDDGPAEYGGWMEVLWDSQETIHDAQGKVTLIGECDHHWQAELVDVATDDSPEDKCDCESPGYFYSGVPGFLAHMENSRLAEGAGVERCDGCRRYATDEAARIELRRRGLGRRQTGLRAALSQKPATAPIVDFARQKVTRIVESVKS